ncbi:MAG: ribosome assembly RNA-binding protein YhbY [Gammaproteobacteria bacterium]|nr:ribosome assembly RNA-binding protein YhbY [Gammaproteobacteria bacterium]
MNLTPRQRIHLRALAHALKPVVSTGQRGLTPAVLNEIEQALGHHELVKVKLVAPDREARREMTEEICRATGCAWVQSIGHIAVLYRPARKPLITLPAGP